MRTEAPWLYFALEFGRFGWGRCAEPILPRQYEIGIARVSVGFGGLSEALLAAMRQAGRARSVQNAMWRRWRLRSAVRARWRAIRAALPVWLAVGCVSLAGAVLVVALTLALSWPQ